MAAKRAILIDYKMTGHSHSTILPAPPATVGVTVSATWVESVALGS